MTDEVHPKEEDQSEVGTNLSTQPAESPRPALEREWIPEPVDCDCCGLPMQYIGLSLYACEICPSDCDGNHAAVDFGGEGPTGCMDDSDELGQALRGMTQQDLNELLDATLNIPERDAETDQG